MATSIDSYSDIEDSELDELTETFNKAAEHVKKLVSTLDSSKLLEIYSYYKQATEGPCKTPKPRWYEAQAKSKWEAWNKLGDISSEEAKKNYIRIISELDSEFDASINKTESWVTVSTLLKTEQNLQESDKTVFDFVKEGNLEKLSSLLQNNAQLINSKDENGLSLIHWSADRGDLNILKYLVNLNLDLNLKDDDGQTPLHYAASCDHFSCVQFLINSGAKIDSEDSEGLKPRDVTSDVKILELLDNKI